MGVLAIPFYALGYSSASRIVAEVAVHPGKALFLAGLARPFSGRRFMASPRRRLLQTSQRGLLNVMRWRHSYPQVAFSPYSGAWPRSS